MENPKEGDDVVFTPSDKAKKKFENKRKDNYPAKITDINENSVDLTVFGVGEIVFVSNVSHKEVAEEGRSHWDYKSAE